MDRIQFDAVSKRYVVGDKKTAREALVDVARGLVRRRRHSPQPFWSLRDVSFAVRDGEALGIIGRNGAGKSTILKIITRITSPTEGASRTRGRVAALLEVGTGFHPELTGRENIYLNGAILGMSRRDITGKFDEIVAFSGVERFLDTPVKRYSSGMGLRLGFSVAAHLDPDILVVDEILAVGDAEFQQRCLNRMGTAEREGRTIVFVSHDLEAVSRLCTRALWLDAGRIREAGSPHDMVRRYLTASVGSTATGTAELRGGPVTVRAVTIEPADRHHEGGLMRLDRLRISVEFELANDVPDFDMAIHINAPNGVRILDEALSDSGPRPRRAGRYRAHMVIPPILNVGDFLVGLWFGTSTAEFLDEPAVRGFTLHGSDQRRPERVVALNLPIELTRLTELEIGDRQPLRHHRVD